MIVRVRRGEGLFARGVDVCQPKDSQQRPNTRNDAPPDDDACLLEKTTIRSSLDLGARR